MLRRNPAVLTLLTLVGAFWLGNAIVFISEDSYFYAVIARNLALRGVQSFWGTEPTNGVHPLWLYLLSAYDWLLAHASADLLYHPAFGVPLTLTLLAVGSFNFIIVAERARLPKSLLVVVPVAYLAFFGVLYSEAHAAYCAHSFLLSVVCAEEEDGRQRPIYVGLAAAAVLLSRLDTVFYIAAFVVWYVARRRSARGSTLMIAALVLPALAYAASNAVWFGGFVPVSGYLKSTFPVPMFTGFWRYPGSVMLTLSGYSVPFGWIPLAVGSVVALVARRRLTGLQTLLYPLLAGTFGHAAYTGFFTAGFTFWYWYYLLPMLLLCWSLACITPAGWRLKFDDTGQWSLVALTAAALFAWRLAPPSEERLRGLVTLREVRDADIDHSTLFVSEWPGTLAFFTHNQVIAADMLTSNRRLVDLVTTSPNGALAVLDEARRVGSPVDYVLYNGGLFFAPDPTFQSVQYRDPRMAQNLGGRIIGSLELGPPLVRRPGVTIWPTTAPPPSGR